MDKPSKIFSSEVQESRPGSEAISKFRASVKTMPQAVPNGSISVNGWTAKVFKQKGAKY